MSSDNASRGGPADEPPKRPDAANEGADDRNVEAYDEALTGDDQPGGGDAIPNEIEQLRQELARAEDRALRTQAELENYRKRAARQIDEERRYANVPLIRDLLPVWDNMGRAIEAGEKTNQSAGLLEGFKLVADQLENVLQQHHCEKIDALGQPFDPNLHQAITQQPSREHPPNTVLGVTQTGFRLHDRVIRPSQVIVSGPATGTEDKTAEASDRPPSADDESQDAADEDR